MSETQGRAITISVLSVALAMLFLFAGAVEKLARPAVAAERFATHFGYPEWMALAIGLLETAGAVGLLIPRLAPFAAAGLSAVMLGAFASHLRAGDPLAEAAVPLVVLGALTALGLLRRQERRAAATPA